MLRNALLMVAAFILMGCARVGTPHQRVSDPFDYCAAVGTSSAVFRGIPHKLVGYVRETFHISTTAPEGWVAENTYWRCKNHKVWVCFGGANIPCEEKANVSRKPTKAMERFCLHHPNEPIPAYVTGHNTVFSWVCRDEKPVAEKVIFKVDENGFISRFWREVEE